ncbi:hypothetical protein MTO96_022204 [Rhipicephalus appendiculatus]
MDITLGPPDTDTPAPHKAPAEVTEAHTDSEAHSTAATLKSVKAQGASSTDLRQKATPNLPHASTPAHVAVRDQPTHVNKTPAANHDKWRPLASDATSLGLPTKGYRDHLACSAVHKSFCGNGSRSPTAQFFYDPAEKSCLLVTVQKAHVCNRSPNQFASRQECETACVGNEPAPEPRCSERPRFVACTAADVHNPWWFHDGQECTPWSFAGGRCPVASAPVFSAAVECNAQCGRAQNLREQGCLFPESHACEPGQLRRPFFAVPKGEDGGGRFECHEVEPELLIRHRCLLGPNSFSSWEERGSNVKRPRLFILVAVALLVVGIFVAAVVVSVADKVNSKNGSGPDSADVPSDSQLDLDQSVTRGSKRDVTHLRTADERAAVSNLGVLAVKVPERGRLSDSLVGVSSAPSKGNEASTLRTPPPHRGQYVASNDEDTRRWYEGVKALDAASDPSG